MDGSLVNNVSLQLRKLDDAVLLALIAHDPEVTQLAAKEAARRMVAERPR